MRQLLLWRHAKAVPDERELDDFDRELSPRGRRDAARMADWIAAHTRPQQVLCSPAARTRETLAALAPRLAAACELRFERALYLAPPERIADELRALPRELTQVLVVGHNPGVHQLALALVRGGEGRARRRLADGFPTASLARLRIRSRHWSELDLEPAELLDFIRPRDLEPASD